MGAQRSVESSGGFVAQAAHAPGTGAGGGIHLAQHVGHLGQRAGGQHPARSAKGVAQAAGRGQRAMARQVLHARVGKIDQGDRGKIRL